jgi:pectate lyase
LIDTTGVEHYICGMTPIARRRWARSAIALSLLGWLASGCSVRDSDLIVAPPGPTPPVLSQAVIDAIDARPVGGASLTTGTSGGGTHAQAAAAGAIYVVSTLADLKNRVSGDAPAVILVAAGRYVGAGQPRTLQVCTQACAATDPVPQGTLEASSCPTGAALSDLTITTDTLRVGSNKTIIGLDAGARLVDVSVVLDGSSNVILRNLSVEGVSSGVVPVNDGISLDPADHVWLDHLTLTDISSASVYVVSTWDQDNAQAIVDESGYVTISNVVFDSFVRGSCSQRSERVLTTNRNPAITVTGSLFEGARIRAPAAFGPGTWMHLYNNLWNDIDGRGLELSCGAAVLAEGNVFQSAHNGLYNSDTGVPTWQFCATGYYGSLYAPLGTGGPESNLVDANSSMNLGGQPTTGTGLALPVSVGGTDVELTVPVASGTKTETYRVTLSADPSTVAADVQAHAGMGRLF